jgi:ribosomal protein L11 methyltransferase
MYEIPPHTATARIRPEDLDLSAGEAFGSGNHPTTRLCLDMLHRYLKPGDRFLDVGTGTGILMVVAHRLGAATVVGFDRYPSVSAIAQANLTANRVPLKRAAVFVSDSPSALRCRFDIAVVNILPGVILSLLGAVGEVLRPGGLLLCSGMILGNTHRVEAGLAETGYAVVCKEKKELWVGIAARKG